MTWIDPSTYAPPAAAPAPSPQSFQAPPVHFADQGSTSSANQTAKGIIEDQLHQWGLDALGAWAWTEFKRTGSMDLVKLEMQDRPEYKARFAGRLALQERGFSMSEAEQISYETQARQLMQQAGMPPQFYDSWHDFTDLIGGGTSVAELSQRINDAFVKVTMAPPEIRQAFGEYYGAGSDSALAAYVLDSKKAAPLIMQQVAASEAGGFLSQQHITVARDIAERAAGAAGFNEGQILQGAQKVGELQANTVFDARFGETAATLEQGIEAGFGNDAASQHIIDQELAQRAASGQGQEHFGRSGEGLGGTRPY